MKYDTIVIFRMLGADVVPYGNRLLDIFVYFSRFGGLFRSFSHKRQYVVVFFHEPDLCNAPLIAHGRTILLSLLVLFLILFEDASKTILNGSVFQASEHLNAAYSRCQPDSQVV